MELQESTHRRYNILTGEWILVSPHRTKRPWQGNIAKIEADRGVRYDTSCYLCPGNERAGGARNPDYRGTLVFTNDFAAILPVELKSEEPEKRSLLVARKESGICRVICFSERHDLSLPLMETQSVQAVVETWAREYTSIASKKSISYVQIFENRGEMMGCSNPHPHGQIWANSSIPDIPAKEGSFQLEYLQKTGSCLLCSYLDLELQLGERVIIENEGFVVLVPFWAVWPFEAMVMPRRHLRSLEELSGEESFQLAAILRRLCIRYDNLFQTSFPYSMGIHQKPTDSATYEAWHMHLHFYPPLLRSAEIKKFMVGYEMLAMPQRDITPEVSASRLRELTEEHYTGR